MEVSARELLLPVLIAAGFGVLAVSAGLALALLGLALIGLILLVMFVRRSTREAEQVHSLVATALVAAGVLGTAWIGIRGPGDVPISDIPFLIAIPLAAAAAVTQPGVLPLPSWLLYSGGALVVSTLLAIMFVVNPPPIVLGEQARVALGASSRASDLALLARMEYSLVLIPILIGAVAASTSRARLLADVWLASAVVCALVGCLDRLAGTGIGVALVGNLEGLQLGDRVTGLTAHPNYLGLFAAMALPVGVARAFQTSGLARLASLTSVGILLVAVQLSGSRLGLITAVLGPVLLFLLVPRFRAAMGMAFAALALVAVISVLVAPSEQSALERLGSSSSTQVANKERFRAIETGLENGLEHPLTGIGFGRIFDSHSIPVQFFQAGGILALAAILLWWFGMGRLGWRLSRDPHLPQATAELAAALTAALMAWLTTGVISPQVSERFLFVPAGLLLGLSLVARRARAVPEWGPMTEPGLLEGAPGAGESGSGPKPVPAGVALAGDPRRAGP